MTPLGDRTSDDVIRLSQSKTKLEEELDFLRATLADLLRDTNSVVNGRSSDNSRIGNLEDQIDIIEEQLSRLNEVIEHNEVAPSKLPSSAVMDERQWENYLQTRYNCLFDRTAVKAFLDATKRDVFGTLAVQMTSEDLLRSLMKPSFPLEGLKIKGGARIHSGPTKPEWHEDASKGKYDDAYASARGFKPFSQGVDNCLQEALDIAITTGGFRSINIWHIAFSLIKVSPPGFSYLLRVELKTQEHVTEVLRSNARRSAPEIYRILPWRLLKGEGIGMNQMPKLAEEDLALLNKRLARISVKPSFALFGALEHATAQCAQVANINRSSLIRIEQVIAGLLTVGLQDELKEHAQVSLPLAILRSSDQSEESIWSLWGRLRETAAINADEHGWTFSHDVEVALVQARHLCEQCTARDSWVATRHFVAAILIRAVAQASFREAMKIVGLDASKLALVLVEHLKFYEQADLKREWRRCLRVVPNLRLGESVQKLGSRVMLKREASPNQLCLGIEDYSSAIQEMFDNAPPENDFVFGLFAPWGRGKSTLIDAVAAKLSATHECVKFGAAKYPSKPEVWVHLYQTVMGAAESSGFWNKWRLRIRVGIIRTGWFPLILGAFTASFPLFVRIGWASDSVVWALDKVGIFGALILAASAYRFFGLGKLMQKDYGHLPNHTEKLGLQAVIGDDFETLLRAWIPSRSNPDLWGKNNGFKEWTKDVVAHFAHQDSALDFRMGRAGWLGMMPCLLLIGWACAKGAYSSWQWISSHNDPSGAMAIWNVMSAVFFLGVCCFTLFGARRITRTKLDAKRVLLVVDDLDRCEPDQSLSVIESIRWFLDNPEVSSRLQVAMLMEKTALEEACKKRAKQFGFAKNENEWKKRFQAHREKLFVLELELPSLVSKETNDLVAMAIAVEEGKLILAEAGEGNSKSDLLESVSQMRVKTPSDSGEEKSGTSSTDKDNDEFKPSGIESKLQEEHRIDLRNQPHSGIQTDNEINLTDDVSQSSMPGHFSAEEREAMIAAFRLVPPTELTPRSIRAAIVRYQFARRLLKGVAFEPTELMDRLLYRMFGGDFQADESTRNSEAMDRVILQLV
ncbi:P-loop NTPase fold protein [Prosthecobacter sp.]|uniref:P-loop NTPase fold protein n=1 Tax=Prosthecobacter sp. TaxID=1965333 RepID=UPI003783512B